MSNFQTKTFEALNLIKLSPKNEYFLQEYKKIAPPCKLNPIPSKVGKIVTWNPTRFTQNYNSLNSIKNNYPYLHHTYDMQSNSKVTSDATYRGRLVAARNNINGFEYLFTLLFSMDFMLVIDRLNASFQDPKKLLS